MNTVILVVGGVAVLYLGFRLVRKIQEMANLSKEDESMAGDSAANTPSDLKSLKLDSDDLQDLEKLEPPPDDRPH